ncbi:MAG: Mg chelatase-like protein [Actinobacteria bacterium]|nr:MAG: Mg chelatase-like protein [Actinomycetota bacterium]
MRESVATVMSVSLLGLEGHIVEVESHVGSGLVAFTLVGLPDTSLKESKDRVRAALQSCSLHMPDHRVTVNLSPAGLPKSGSGFDLAIAMSVLIADGSLPAGALSDTIVLGELALDGSLRPIRGILPALMSASQHGFTRAIVPTQCQSEADLVPGIEIHSFDHLADVICWAGGQAYRPQTRSEHTHSANRLQSGSSGEKVRSDGDLVDVRGQAHARHALEVAAAGGHHLHLVGEPGSGKTMLATRMPTVLPDLDDETALTTTAIHSVAGALKRDDTLIRTPPLYAPHHSMTLPALIGGGHTLPRPGAVSLAHGGILFLDEAPEFAPSVLDALRQPLEDGVVSLHRARGHTRYPARFQLILASNPCPCGQSGARLAHCECTSLEKRRYQARLSGPLRDRIDITVPMRTPTRADLATDSGEHSSDVKARVIGARERQAHRLAHTPWSLNAHLPGAWIRKNTPIPSDIRQHLDSAIDRGTLSMRGADRVLRLLWTIADLNSHNTPDMADLALALVLRSGQAHDLA